MSSSYDLLQTALASEFSTDQRGRPVTYNGDPINAIYSIGQNPDGIGTRLDQRSRKVADGTIKILKSDVATWNYRDLVIIDGVEWRIQGLIADRSFYWKLRMDSDRRSAP